MHTIKNRKIVFVKKILQTATFEHDIKLGFEVDEMIVRSITVGTVEVAGPPGGGGGGGGGGPVFFYGVNTVHMEGVGEVCQFTGQETHTPNYAFTIGRNMDGIKRFTLLDVDGASDIFPNDAQLCLVLEFIQYCN